MKRETIFLKFFLVLMGLPILALCIFVIPTFAKVAAEDFLGQHLLQYPIILGVYGTAAAYYIALYQAYKLLSLIDRNEAFSNLSVTALKIIKRCAFTISLLYVLSMPIFFIVADKDDAPGVVLVGLSFILAAISVAFFAAVLQKLLKQAIDIKTENELTV